MRDVVGRLDLSVFVFFIFYDLDFNLDFFRFFSVLVVYSSTVGVLPRGFAGYEVSLG